MDLDNLHELINRYEEDLDRIYNDEHDELFKWRAMKTWQDEWFRPEASFQTFAERYSAASKDFSLFMDNSRMHPSSGVLKLWEKEPETVEELFNVLLKNTGNDIAMVQDNMDAFLEGHELLRQKHFPRNWSYKQDRHSASVYLALNDPSLNYAYKSSEATMLARYIGFGYNIGAGTTFSLENYYKLGDDVVAALKEHPGLLDRHFNKLTDACYEDRSLHLLAFDIMYCSRAYNYYKGLVPPERPNKIKRKATVTEIPEEVLAQREAERLARIASIEEEIADLERSTDGFEDISLIGVQVTSANYGVGTIVEQNINMITVAFYDGEKKFKLDKQYTNRPCFEDDKEIIEAFTNYGHAQEQIKKLRKELDSLQKI